MKICSKGHLTGFRNCPWCWLKLDRDGAIAYVLKTDSATRPAIGMHLQVRRTMSRRAERRRQHEANRLKNLQAAGQPG